MDFTNSSNVFKTKYENFINGEWKSPKNKEYAKNLSPIDGRLLCEVPNSSNEDVEDALDAANNAKASWGRTSATNRALLLEKIARICEDNLELLAHAETLDNGKPIRETLGADVPLFIDHFRYFAGCIRAQEGGISELDDKTIAYHFYEPMGVVAQIIPWNFPLLMAAWKVAPALAAGNTIVLKPSSATPASVLVFIDLIKDILPKGILNVINGSGGKIGKHLATSNKINKIAFTGSTEVGREILGYTKENIIPSTLELGGKSPNIFFNDIMSTDDELIDKAIEGLLLFAFNQGEVCSCPSRALIQEDIYDEFIKRVLKRLDEIKYGNPLDIKTMVGAQASKEQLDKIINYIKLGKEEGAEVLAGGEVNKLGGDLNNGFYIKPTIFKGHNKMKIFREEIFGPVLALTTFKDEEEALSIANDSPYGLAAGVWTRDNNRAYKMSRGLEVGRVWVNCYHHYPAHAAFGGYKQSGIGRETHKMMLNHYQQVKNILVSYDPNKMGFF